MSMGVVAAIAAPLIIGGINGMIQKGKAKNMEQDVFDAARS